MVDNSTSCFPNLMKLVHIQYLSKFFFFLMCVYIILADSVFPLLEQLPLGDSRKGFLIVSEILGFSSLAPIKSRVKG